MQKDRFVFALIIYGIALLIGAGVCSFVTADDISAVANTGVEAEQHLPTEGVKPTQTVEQAVQQEPDVIVPEIQDSEPNDDEADTEESAEDIVKDAWALLRVETTKEWRETIGEKCIVLPKPEAATEAEGIHFSFTDMPVEHSFALTFQGCVQSEYGYENIERIVNGQYFRGNPSAVSDTNDSVEHINDPLCNIAQLCIVREDGSCELNLEFVMDKAYVYNVYETESHYFIALMEAKEVYDRIVVLDAGHGGWDTGTSSHDGKYLEKDINLQVLIYLEDMLRAENIKVYATRTTDRSIGHTERIDLANSLRADMFISIHCNNAYKNPEANGTESLYTQYDAENGLNSHLLSQICQEELISALQLNDRGLFARGDDLTVLQKAEVPATVVELAFMSNEADMALLKTEEAQRLAADALYHAILRAYECMEAETEE